MLRTVTIWGLFIGVLAGCTPAPPAETSPTETSANPPEKPSPAVSEPVEAAAMETKQPEFITASQLRDHK